MRNPTKFPSVTHYLANTLRENMVALREKKDMKPVEICKKIGENGISLSQFTRYESGETQMSINYVYDFCRVFGVTISDLEKRKF